VPDDFHVEVKGGPELAAGSRRLAGNIEQSAPRAFARVADKVAGQVKGRVPRRTGRLAASVTGDITGRGASVSMGAGVPYAQYVEYGGRGHPHSTQGNYLYPAAIDAGPQLRAAGERAAEDEIGRMNWPRPN
jgi:phage gpG-like protein